MVQKDVELNEKLIPTLLVPEGHRKRRGEDTLSTILLVNVKGR